MDAFLKRKSSVEGIAVANGGEGKQQDTSLGFAAEGGLGNNEQRVGSGSDSDSDSDSDGGGTASPAPDEAVVEQAMRRLYGAR